MLELFASMFPATAVAAGTRLTGLAVVPEAVAVAVAAAAFLQYGQPAKKEKEEKVSIRFQGIDLRSMSKRRV